MQLFLYFYTSSIDPGIPAYENQTKEGTHFGLKYCKRCKLWSKRFTENAKQIKTFHCKICDICIEGMLRV